MLFVSSKFLFRQNKNGTLMIHDYREYGNGKVPTPIIKRKYSNPKKRNNSSLLQTGGTSSAVQVSKFKKYKS